jgi:hypothetical protein
MGVPSIPWPDTSYAAGNYPRFSHPIPVFFRA